MQNRTPDFAEHLETYDISYYPDALKWGLRSIDSTVPKITIKISSNNPFDLEPLILKFIKEKYRIVLAGPGGCGKNFAKDLLVRSGFKYGPSYTSRAIREGEVNGEDYHFITTEEFQRMVDRDEFYEYVQFGDKFYGTTKKQFYEDCNLFIMTADGVGLIEDEDRENTIVIYFDISQEILQKRLKGRGDSDEKVAARVEEDWELFADWKDYDIRIREEFFTREQILHKVQGLFVNLEKIYS